ncbi:MULTISPECIES: helix-turn-helix domain-containing protein [Bradyrhizobium]|jgi:transcriptional regulator GlxA family with amidase domain|uniref:Transcriptional regulator GlxA family with amidase domain n=1 Tax=Bradyrhizobium japonicum TaxID=375 RepID=A0ABV2RH13_BRAJP|nr:MULTISPECIES: helix-turn-helix domain-containing protein [Bradyrhizobium]MCP1768280.1 AraC family ethanolamine operon transcriptional activator [Bradyrhizobium japonicum]MCP1794441.1 AraC family ethanolamine operon transcriptional activator [Bradyrhizobium japonicum]MCP1811292.1 AraC family ethanolamine operon transcriptional activator [Bradyrhizobium japonicum]MCP1821343.1 AraC family ethanolamine operon transcriptional activator [Bradyrhizobium japonicum]MCP1876378.1 AraC family ethanolam
MDGSTTRRQHHLVKQAKKRVLADLQNPPSIAALCRRLGIGYRTLLRAFENVHGVSPLQYFQMLRLARVRRALMSARSLSVIVAKTATRFGFRQLGRFSVEYRTVFGESPSETLRHAVHGHERRRRVSKG